MSKKLTHEEFLEKLWENNEHYRNGDFKVVGIYKDAESKIVIKNKYGYLKVGTDSLFKNYSPIITSAIFKTKYLIRFLEVNNKYYKKDFYVTGEYVNAKTRIKCETKYGPIFMKYEGLIKNKSFRFNDGFDSDFMLNRFKEVHNDLFEYKFKKLRMHDKVSIKCEEHGWFEQEIGSHLSGCGCPKCGIVKQSKTQLRSHFDFIKDLKEIQKERYDLSKVKYINAKEKITLVCEQHGDFLITPSSALRGSGCSKCAKEISGYKFSQWEKSNTGNKGILYLLEFYDKNEKFLKIGISSLSVKERYKMKIKYKYKKIIEIKSFDRRLIWDTEVFIKKKYRPFKYTPKNPFTGCKTEVFKYSELENIKKDIIEIHSIKDGITPKEKLKDILYKMKVEEDISKEERSRKLPFGRKFTEEQVIEIKSYSNYTGLSKFLAKKYNVSPSTIKNIRNGHSYKNLTIT